MIVSFPRQIVNHSESEILHFISAYNKTNQQFIFSDNFIPKATEVAITILNKGEAPVNASLKLKNSGRNQKLVQLIEPGQTEQFCFEALQDCTLGDFELKVAKNVNKEVSKSLEKERPLISETGSEDDKISLKRKIEDSEVTDLTQEKEATGETSSLKKTKTEKPKVALTPKQFSQQLLLDVILWDYDNKKQISGKEVSEGLELGLLIRSRNELNVRVVCRVDRIDETRILSCKGKVAADLHKGEWARFFTFIPREEDQVIILTFMSQTLPLEGPSFWTQKKIRIIANTKEIRTA